MNKSHYIKNPTFRKFENVGRGRTYYVPIDEFLNAADNILVDVHDPKSAGFGGSLFDIKTTEGVDEVKGPWHGTCPYDVCNVTELHFTKVTLVANAEQVPYIERGTYFKGIEARLHMRGDLLYEEKEPVLGTFHRGDRIAQQLADLRQEDIYFHVESNGGSHSGFAKPGGRLHPNAHRSGNKRHNDLSTEQSSIVER